jgi:regulator of protease activity HflC (stomatin/prohibitin superfamily)
MNLIGIAAFILLFVFLTGLRIAKEYERAVVFRLGRYAGLRGPGLYWLIPLGIETKTRIDLRVVTAPIEQQETITRDSVTVKVNAVL